LFLPKFGADPFDEVLKTLCGTPEEPSAYTELRDWIRTQAHGENVLLVVPDHYPRPEGGLWLRIMFERRRDIETFTRAHPAAQAITQQLRTIIQNRSSKIDASFVQVSFSAFAEEFRLRTPMRVSAADRAAILESCNDQNLWLLHPMLGGFVFFFHTDQHLHASLVTGVRDRCRRELDKMLTKYDAFGYLAEEPLPPGFDSRERFKRDFNEHWGHYDR
jgi:hypothetical protein